MLKKMLSKKKYLPLFTILLLLDKVGIFLPKEPINKKVSKIALVFTIKEIIKNVFR